MNYTIKDKQAVFQFECTGYVLNVPTHEHDHYLFCEFLYSFDIADKIDSYEQVEYLIGVKYFEFWDILGNTSIPNEKNILNKSWNTFKHNFLYGRAIDHIRTILKNRYTKLWDNLKRDSLDDLIDHLYTNYWSALPLDSSLLPVYDFIHTDTLIMEWAML